MNKILIKKTYLYATEFFAGMSVMAVELGASRLLAPYFSSSQIVWTIIIGTIMIAMAMGNAIGGRWADKDDNPDKLYKRLIIAALWIVAIPFLGKFVIIGISLLLVKTVSTNFLITAAFLACMIIFVFPLFLLGTVTPSLIKYSTKNLGESGRVAGNLGAFNTTGSIIGTFLPTFVTIPAVGTAVTFHIFSGIILLIGIIYFVSFKRKIGLVVASGIIFIIFVIAGNTLGFAFWEKGIVLEDESVYNYLLVKEDDESITLSTNVLFGVQSVKMKNDELTDMYYDYASVAPLMSGMVNSEDEGDILVLGMGTGTFAGQCYKYYPKANITGVEIDNKIKDISREYFDLEEEIKVYEYDGRAYLNVDDKKYDVIMVDAYQDITIPFQMSTVEFFEMVKSHLKENGVMVVNLNMYTKTPGDINDYLIGSIDNVFDKCFSIDVEDSCNREVFAFNDKADSTKWRENFSEIDNNYLRKMARKVSSNLKEYKRSKHILTDDKAPVELLGMKTIDVLINEEIENVKSIDLDFLEDK